LKEILTWNLFLISFEIGFLKFLAIKLHYAIIILINVIKYSSCNVLHFKVNFNALFLSDICFITLLLVPESHSWSFEISPIFLKDMFSFSTKCSYYWRLHRFQQYTFSFLSQNDLVLASTFMEICARDLKRSK
jgi:hypothetical protein